MLQKEAEDWLKNVKNSAIEQISDYPGNLYLSPLETYPEEYCSTATWWFHYEEQYYIYSNPGFVKKAEKFTQVGPVYFIDAWRLGVEESTFFQSNSFSFSWVNDEFLKGVSNFLVGGPHPMVLMWCNHSNKTIKPLWCYFSNAAFSLSAIYNIQFRKWREFWVWPLLKVKGLILFPGAQTSPSHSN